MSPRQFDGLGNYTFGLNEQVMFHEIDQDRIDRLRGMDITFVTSATTDDEGRSLLKHLGFPFKADADVVAKVKRKGGRPIKGASKSANKALLKKKK
jgi:large subunit ribosomal protein L5